eukprot:g21030.t1
MASASRSVAAAAGAAALVAGTSFVSAPVTSNLRATTAGKSAASAPIPEAASSRTASLAVAGAAFAALTASGRKALGSSIKPQLVSLSAFENELGVQAPVGFWDPAGFTADGSVEDFKRRRQTELKHGRISMLATMGYITPEKLIGNDVSCQY